MDQKTKTVFAFDPATRIYVGPVILDASDLSPVEEGVFLIPGNCLESEPPAVPEGMRAIEAAGAWLLEQIPVVPVDPPVPPLTEAQRIANLRIDVQRHLDAAAVAMGYDDMRNAVTYAEEPAVPRFQNEGRALRAWRSLVWAKCYDVLDEWNAGAIQEPTSAELIAMLPELVMPA
ncbi:hypothetical protein [Variovorax sp. PAMC26660]|uniref:hypothetical protein n=1 Tax=Variovorax sp. PAMC26660 TaxID=2762322 RepID=UPI00164E1B88|nr:hypothetical protein [Variovorax sp. PAMC26660]QNK67828.1 hypothetical protein H7F35_32680 [Variovorax sp. PAMC26660]